MVTSTETSLIVAAAGAAAALAALAAVWLAERNVRVRGPRRAAADDALARQAAPSVETVEVAAADGVTLSAWLLHPERWRGEAVLLLHGFVDNRAAMLDHARMLLRHGFAVLAPDSRGHGASGGDAVSFGVREARDVSTWADWLCARLGLEAFAGVGQSMGAVVLLNALPAESRLARVVAESPFTSFREAAYDRLAGRTGVPRWAAHWLFRPVGELAFLYVRWRYGFNLHRTRPVDALRSSSQPVLLIHGDCDRAILARHSRRLHAAAPPGRPADYWEVEGAGHTEPIRVAAAEYERRVIGWLTSRPGENQA